MSLSRDAYPVELLRGDGSGGVPATVRPDPSRADLLAVEAAWGPARLEAARRMLAAGGELEHDHWNWVNKAHLLARRGVRCLSVECDGAVQGLLMVDLLGHAARVPPDAGEGLVYVEFLEAAPWNLPLHGAARRFRGVGVVLLAAAVRVSRDRGLGGRVGLHALPQAERFYNGVCGMTVGGPDPGHDGLTYFEFTAAQAAGFVGS